MPRPGPRMEQVALRLDAETLAKLDAAVEREERLRVRSGIPAQPQTRSDVLRRAVVEYLSR